VYTPREGTSDERNVTWDPENHNHQAFSTISPHQTDDWNEALCMTHSKGEERTKKIYKAFE
jgi:hypothetical protein